MAKDSIIFDILNNITQEKIDKWYMFERRYPTYMINKFLSMNERTIYYADIMNKSVLPPKLQYNFYLTVIPKGKYYFNYPKKIETDKKEDEIIELIVKHYKINNNRAKEYLKMLDKESINNIVQLYDHGGTG